MDFTACWISSIDHGIDYQANGFRPHDVPSCLAEWKSSVPQKTGAQNTTDLAVHAESGAVVTSTYSLARRFAHFDGAVRGNSMSFKIVCDGRTAWNSAASRRGSTVFRERCERRASRPGRYRGLEARGWRVGSARNASTGMRERSPQRRRSGKALPRRPPTMIRRPSKLGLPASTAERNSPTCPPRESCL